VFSKQLEACGDRIRRDRLKVFLQRCSSLRVIAKRLIARIKAARLMSFAVSRSPLSGCFRCFTSAMPGEPNMSLITTASAGGILNRHRD